MVLRIGPKGSLAEVLAERVGFRSMIKVLTFIVSWGTVYEDLGREPSIEEFADWWKSSRAKAFRDQQLFRKAMPEFDTPTLLWERARAHVDASNQAAPVLLGALVLT